MKNRRSRATSTMSPGTVSSPALFSMLKTSPGQIDGNMLVPKACRRMVPPDLRTSAGKIEFMTLANLGRERHGRWVYEVFRLKRH